MEEKIFSISEYIKIVDQGLKNFRAKIIGEVSKVDFGPTGNVYFYLKDEKDQSTLKCMIYKNKYEMYGIKLEEGVKIIAEGYPNLHRFYSFAFIAEIIEYSGEGTLRKEYEKLKKKLSEEGLFAEERKRSIPLYPQKIGVITSLKGGEVIADFSNNLGRFGFKVKMIDSRVEGQVAVNDLLLSIRALKKQDIEVLVIMRGGGSLESMMPLMPFNNELLIREVINFPVPVLAAIGHHKDVPLMALAADLNVSTPSIAATTLNESWKQATLFLERHERNIIDNYGEVLDGAQKLINQATETIREYCDSIIDEYREIENGLKISLSNFQNALFNVKINLDDLINKSFSGFKALIIRANKQLEYTEKAINSNNPERQLALGYSIARHGDRIIRRIKDVRTGQEMDLRVSDGTIISKIKNINKNKNA
jgi:exodeoxyribonuclease VII large subunit